MARGNKRTVSDNNKSDVIQQKENNPEEFSWADTVRIWRCKLGIKALKFEQIFDILMKQVRPWCKVSPMVKMRHFHQLIFLSTTLKMGKAMV